MGARAQPDATVRTTECPVKAPQALSKVTCLAHQREYSHEGVSGALELVDVGDDLLLVAEGEVVGFELVLEAADHLVDSLLVLVLQRRLQGVQARLLQRETQGVSAQPAAGRTLREGQHNLSQNGHSIERFVRKTCCQVNVTSSRKQQSDAARTHTHAHTHTHTHTHTQAHTRTRTVAANTPCCKTHTNTHTYNS